jgi:hypothetical protein
VTPDVAGDMVYDPFGGTHALLPRRADSYRAFIDADSGACTPYTMPGVISGAGGAFATVAAEIDLFRKLFHGWPERGENILTEASVLEIIRPRKQIAPDAPWFGQGVVVIPSPVGDDAHPTAVLYCGGIECTNTCVSSGAGGVVAAWSNVEMANVTQAEYASLAHMSMTDALSGGIQGITYPYNSAAPLVQDLAALWFPAEAEIPDEPATP